MHTHINMIMISSFFPGKCSLEGFPGRPHQVIMLNSLFSGSLLTSAQLSYIYIFGLELLTFIKGNKALELQILRPKSLVIVLNCPLIGCWATEGAKQRAAPNNSKSRLWGSKDLYFLNFFTCIQWGLDCQGDLHMVVWQAHWKVYLTVFAVQWMYKALTQNVVPTNCSDINS